MNSIRWIVAATLAVTGSNAASAAGYVVCAAASPSQGKFFYSAPFAGENAATGALTTRYVAMLRADHYAAPSMYAPPGSAPPPLEAGCIWRATEAEAKNAIENMIAGVRERRLAPLGTPFSGE